MGGIRDRTVDGWFGPVYTQFEGKANEAESYLRETTEGVAKGALTYPGIEPIDLVWGDMKAGYMKIVIKHPEVVGKLQEILDGTTITSKSDNRIVFESDTHKMVVSRMKGSLPTDNWLLTAYEKKEKPVSASSSDIETEPKGKRNGTATPQNGAISADKVSASSGEMQENSQEKRSISAENANVGQSSDSSYWNVNSGWIFRKGYSNKKETVAKTEPQQPNNAVSTGPSLPANESVGISQAEPNGEPTVSADKVTESSENIQGKTEENS